MLTKILQMVLALTPAVVNGLQTTITDANSGATKKAVATDILTAAFNGLAQANQVQTGATFSKVSQLIDAGIEIAVAELNTPSSPAPSTTPGTQSASGQAAAPAPAPGMGVKLGA
jgi:hypothetical protein